MLVTLTIASLNEDEPMVPNSILMVLYVITTIAGQRIANPVRPSTRFPHQGAVAATSSGAGSMPIDRYGFSRPS